MLSKVQGYGLIRQSFLPLFEELGSLSTLRTSLVDYLSAKTNNIYKIVYLATYETYLNEVNEVEEP